MRRRHSGLHRHWQRLIQVEYQIILRDPLGTGLEHVGFVRFVGSRQVENSPAWEGFVYIYLAMEGPEEQHWYCLAVLLPVFLN